MSSYVLFQITSRSALTTGRSGHQSNPKHHRKWYVPKIAPQPFGNLVIIMQYETRFSEDTCNPPRSSELLDVMFDTRRMTILRNFATTCCAFLSNCFSIHLSCPLCCRCPTYIILHSYIICVLCCTFIFLEPFRLFHCNIQSVFL
jgi:hypothetical protein